MFLFNQLVSNQYCKVMVLSAVFFLIVGCGPEASAKPQPLAPCESVNSQIYTGNFYPELQSMDATEVADSIYRLAYQNLALAKREALRFLSYETERWSDPQYVTCKSQPCMRVIVSFITPGLVRAIILNHLLSTYDPAQVTSLNVVSNESLTKLDKKEEFAFFILIQTKESAPLSSFSIYPSDIQLHTTDGYQVKSTHNDDFLNLQLDVSKKEYSGLIFYPAQVIKKGICGPLLKPDSETSLMLKIDTAKIDDQNSMLHWQFHLPLFVALNKPMFEVDTLTPAQNGEDGYEKPLNELPVGEWSEAKDVIVWRDVGRFIWSKLIMEGIPEQ